VAVVDFSGGTADETAVEVERERGEALALRADVTREEAVAVAATIAR
jgi:NAD(P)-dependent dehydrogenase (short-subunit alcohol dehydrogenase family)